MDHTGETGDQIEPAVDAEPVDAVLEEVEIVIEVEVETETEELAADDGDTGEIEPDEIESDELAAEAVDTDEDDAVAEETSATRERHPAGAAALAKRVAMDRPTRIGVASLVFVALMFMFVFPTRSYLAQQRQVRDAHHSVQVLRAQNAKLAAEAQRLQTPSEIEKLARSQFNMVYEGEQAYSVVSPHGSATTTTTEP